MAKDLTTKTYHIILFDYYGELLTIKQQEMFISHYLEDYSLNEIAQTNNISRNAVFDTIKTVITNLDHYEKILKLYEEDIALQKLLETAEESDMTKADLIKKMRERG